MAVRRKRGQLNGSALGRELGVKNQVAVTKLGSDLGGGGFSDAVTLEAEQALVQAWGGSDGKCPYE